MGLKRKLFESFIKDALSALLPPEKLTVSQWAQAHRVLDGKTSAIPGEWSNDQTPYLVEIMDEFNNPETEQIVFVKPTQVGGTEALLNAIGYFVGQDPRPILLVEPTELLAISVSENRLQPMLQLSPQLSEKYLPRESTQTEIQCQGAYISLSGANSPSRLASKAIGLLLLDEVDKYPGASNKEADPVSLAIERTKTYGNRKIFMTSTPTYIGGHIWQAKESADVEKHYFVPCPHCDEWIELIFGQIKWPKDDEMSQVGRAELACYICQNCGAMIGDAQKPLMLRRGQWREVKRRSARATTVCFWMNTLYSPFVTWAGIARAFLLSKNDPEKLQNFKNSWLAEPWQDRITTTDADMVLARQSEYERFEVPEQAHLLTGGVDVQKDCVYWTIRAWGSYLTSWNVAHGQALSLEDIPAMMDQIYKKRSGELMQISLCAIDSGDQTDMVYDFCQRHCDWAIAVKGASHSMMGHYRISHVNKANSRAQGLTLVLVNTDRYKDAIAAHIRNEGRGAWMVHNDCDRDYAEQVTAEQKVNIRRGGQMVQKWQPKTTHAANHFFDTEVYAFVAADLMNVRGLYRDEEGSDAG